MEVSVEKQFKESQSRSFLYSGLLLFSTFLLIFFGYLNFVQAANPPSIITYQGKLLNGSVAVTTTQAISYILYDASVGGNALYSAAGTTISPLTVSTTVTDGFFTIDLGDTGTNAIDPTIFKNNQAVYLQVTVGGETLVPRKRITASPYALNAKYLDGIGASSTPQAAVYIPMSDSNGNFNFNNVTSTGITATNLTAVSSTFTNATTTGSFWSNLLTATTGWFTNLFYTDATSTGITHLNTLVTTGNTTLATTTISSSTIGALNVSNNTNIGGLLSVTGNSSFGTITAGTWSGTIISNAKGGTGQDSSGWTGFVKTSAGTWVTSTISTADLSNSSTLAFLSNNQSFTGINNFASSTITSLSSTSGTISNLNSTGITVTNLISASSTFTNATTTGSFWSNLLTATTGWFTNLFWTDATSTGITHLNTLFATGNTTLATTTISSSTIGSLNISNNTNIGGLLSVTGNSAFGTITSGTWSGTIISNAKGGTGQDSSGWTGFVKTTAGTWVTSTISTTDLSNASAIAFLANDQIFTGTNTFATTTITSLSSTSGTISNLNSTGITATNLTAVSSTFTNATTTGSFWSNLLTATTGWFTNLFYTDATSTGITHLNTLVATGNTTLATTTIASSTIGALIVSNNTNIGGLLSVTGNSAFGNITSGTWNGTIISSAKGGTGQDSSGWTGFVKTTAGTWVTSTISTADLTNSSTIAFLANNQTFTGLNVFTATTTFASSTFNGYVGIGTSTPAYNLDVAGNFRATGQTFLSAGSSSTPSLSFANDPDTGLYNSAPNTIAFTYGGLDGHTETYIPGAHTTVFNNPNFAATGSDTAWVFDTTVASGFGGDRVFIVKGGGAEKFNISATGGITSYGSFMSVSSGGADYTFTHGGSKGGIIMQPSGGQYFKINQLAQTSGSSAGLWVLSGTHTGLTAATEVNSALFDFSSNKTWAAGAGPLATQREFSVLAPTYNGNVGAPLVMTNASTFAISGAPIQGTNITIANPLALWVQSGKSRFDGDLSVTGSIGIGTTTPSEKLHVNGGNILHTAFGNPTLKGTAFTTSSIGVYVSGKYAYVADYDSGLRIIDISNPVSPVTVGVVSTSGRFANGVYVSGNYAYLTDYSSGIRIVDISNPASPILMSDTSMGGTTGLYVSGKYAYLANGTGGLRVTDISNPSSPSLAGTASTTNAIAVYVSGKYAYVADGISGMRVVDISNSHYPAIIGTVNITNALGVYVSGKYAYVAAGTSGLKIVDVSNPATPVVTSTYAASDARGVYVSGRYAYVADNSLGLLVVDISNPASPLLIGTYSIGNIRGLYVSGKYAYLAAGSQGLKIIDINGLDAPTMNVGNIATNDLTVSENVDVGNNLNIRNGLNLGLGGLLSNGAVAITVSTTVSTSTLFSIGTSTANMLVVMGNGQVFVNADSNAGLVNQYKMYINGGGLNNAGLGVNGYIVASGYITGTSTLDLAETYPINLSCSINGSCPVPGDVVCSDITVVAGVKKCSLESNDSIIGIVSTNPGFLLGGADFSSPNNLSGKVKVALAGRVPTKITAANGAIKVGDKLMLSNIAGVAAKAVGEAQTVGVAMENYSSTGIGEIIIFINLGWQNELYRGLSIDINSSTLNVGTELTPYNLVLNGEMTMFNNVLNKLVFNATALFESKTNSSHAFIFNAVNFGNSPEQYLLSLRSNDQPRFSVLSNGDVRASGNIYAASAVFGTSSNPGDLAERVDIAADDTVEPGDVLVVDMNNPDTYRRSSGANQQSVAGVVSTNPTIVVGNGKTEFTTVMAMVGRVPLKVSDENGAINRGDLLVTASTTGYAMKYNPKKDNGDEMVGVVGVALDPLLSGKGKIMALVRTGWVNSRYESISSIKDNIQQLATAQGIVLGATSTTNLNIEKNNSGQLVYSGGDLNLQGNTLLNVASIVGKNNNWTIDTSGHFITRLNTSQGEKEMYAIQSPTSEFVFSSSSQLMAGEAKIIFDQTMQDVIDAQQPLKINITLTSGEAKGIYVSEKSAQGFTVKELSGGSSAATFDWMVVAKRKEEITGLNVVNTSVITGDIQVVNIQTTTVTNNFITSSTPAVVSSSISVAPSQPVLSAPLVTPTLSVAPPVTPEVIVSTPAVTPINIPAPAPAPAPIISAPVVNTVETAAPPTAPAPTQTPAPAP